MWNIDAGLDTKYGSSSLDDWSHCLTVARVSGLLTCRTGDLVLFFNRTGITARGMVLNLKSNSVAVVVFAEDRRDFGLRVLGWLLHLG